MSELVELLGEILFAELDEAIFQLLPRTNAREELAILEEFGY